MKIHFLGTGTSKGNPVIGSDHPVCLSKDKRDIRLRSSILVTVNNLNILIDCSPDFRYQMIRNNHSNVDYIFLTHEHSDHVLGLDDLRPVLFLKNKKIFIYSYKRVIDSIICRFPYLFLQGEYCNLLKLCNINNYENFIIDNIINITPLSIIHGKLNILGFKINSFAYITDASFIPLNSLRLLKNLDVLVINALRLYPYHNSHFILSQTLKIIHKLSPNRTYITHISHDLGFYSKISKILPSNVELAYDNLIVYV